VRMKTSYAPSAKYLSVVFELGFLVMGGGLGATSLGC
jgi:hypothetical protein